jgi:hypothetical protein
VRKNTQRTVQSKWLADFSCLLLYSDSVSYCNICRKYSDFTDKKSLMFIGKIVDRMDTYLPTSHLQSMKTPLKLNTWLVWWIKSLSRLIKMNLIDMRIFFNTAYFVSKNNWLFSYCTFLSEIQIWNGLQLGNDHLGRDVCVNFIKTIFQILRNDVIDNINKFNLATVFVSIKCLYKKQDK